MKATLVLAALLLSGGVPLVLDHPTAGSLLLCHFAHLSLRHLLFSGLATLVLSLALERRIGTARLSLLLVPIVTAVSAAVLVFEHEHLLTYRGASGIGYALASALAVQERKRVAIPVLIFLAVKIGFEFVTGRCLVDVSLEAAGAVPVPIAHAVGIAAGAAGGRMAADSFHRPIMGVSVPGTDDGNAP